MLYLSRYSALLPMILCFIYQDTLHYLSGSSAFLSGYSALFMPVVFFEKNDQNFFCLLFFSNELDVENKNDKVFWGYQWGPKCNEPQCSNIKNVGLE